MSEEATNPVVDEPVEGASVEGVADEANAQGDDQSQLDDDGNPIEEDADDDSEEIEHEGAKYKVPKNLAKEFREGTLRQADYTRKTQEIAQTRSALDTERQTLAQQAEVHAATLTERVQLATLETQLAQFADFDWADYERQYGAGAVATAMAQWRTLESRQTELKGSITEKESEFVRNRDQATETVVREANTVLQREIPNYGPELVQKVAEIGHSLGITGPEIRDSLVGNDGKPDVRLFKALHELADLRAYKTRTEAKTTKAQTAEKVAAVKPAATVNAKANGYRAGLDDSLPLDEWNRRRNAQLAKANGR